MSVGVNAKEKYLLGLLTEIKREIICQDVLRENSMQAENKTMNWYRFTDRTKDKVLTVLLILMGDDVPTSGLYSYRDYSVLYGLLDEDENFSRNV
jgi:hypothetical protein